MSGVFGDFHFLRPAWLLLLPLCLLLAWGLSRHHRQGSVWRHVVDAHLLPWLSTVMTAGHYRRAVQLLAVAWVLAIIALAGPVWERLPQPVFKAESVRLLILDLSRSMDARDIRPSRLTRARHKVLDMLHEIHEGQVGLIVFAGQPHVVSPLTDDAATIAAMVPVLTTGIMPAQGSDLLSALQMAHTMLGQSGVPRADIIVIADGLDNLFAVDFAKQIRGHGHRVSVLGVGTAEGAPIPARRGGFVKDRDGAIVVSSLADSLKDVAKLGGGIYRDLTVDDSDIKALLSLSAPDNLQRQRPEDDERNSDVWRDAGVWLLPPLLLAAALSFRRGWLLTLLLAVNLWPAQAARADGWQDLWRNGNQRGVQAFAEERYQEAVEAFTDRRWQAAAHYRLQQYDQALQLLESQRNAQGHYNRGNVLARLGRVTDAISAYDQALSLDPGHEDAAHNKRLLERFVRRARQQNQQGQPSPQQNGQPDQAQGSGAGAGDQQAGTTGSSGDPGQQSGRAGDRQGEQGSGGEQEQGQTGEQQADNKDQGATEQARQELKEGQQEQGGTTRSVAGDGQDPERQQAIEQWLGRIPDDPGGLLKQKFLRQYQRRGRSNDGDKW